LQAVAQSFVWLKIPIYTYIVHDISGWYIPSLHILILDTHITVFWMMTHDDPLLT